MYHGIASSVFVILSFTNMEVSLFLFSPSLLASSKSTFKNCYQFRSGKKKKLNLRLILDSSLSHLPQTFVTRP
jgi:hypothetical protein